MKHYVIDSNLTDEKKENVIDRKKIYIELSETPLKKRGGSGIFFEGVEIPKFLKKELKTMPNQPKHNSKSRSYPTLTKAWTSTYKQSSTYAAQPLHPRPSFPKPDNTSSFHIPGVEKSETISSQIHAQTGGNKRERANSCPLLFFDHAPQKEHNSVKENVSPQKRHKFDEEDDAPQKDQTSDVKNQKPRTVTFGEFDAALTLSSCFSSA